MILKIAGLLRKVWESRRPAALHKHFLLVSFVAWIKTNRYFGRYREGQGVFSHDSEVIQENFLKF